MLGEAAKHGSEVASGASGRREQGEGLRHQWQLQQQFLREKGVFIFIHHLEVGLQLAQISTIAVLRNEYFL